MSITNVLNAFHLRRFPSLTRITIGGRFGLAALALAGIAMALSAARVYAGGNAMLPALILPSERVPEVNELLHRARATERLLSDVEALYHSEVEPIQQVLMEYRRDPVLTHRIAMAVVREAHRADLEPHLLLAVLLVENPALEPAARSPVGARGLMQVMPLHRGQWSACRGDMVNIETNICYGARIFADNLRRTGGNVERALLGYNGCVRGTNTPNCREYPYHVFARAGRASIQSWMAQRNSDRDY